MTLRAAVLVFGGTAISTKNRGLLASSGTMLSGFAPLHIVLIKE